MHPTISCKLSRSPAVITATVNLSSANTNVGTIGSQLVFNGGDQYGTIEFDALAAGSTTLSITSPSGFSAPAQAANTVSVTVTAAGLTAPSVMVGQYLELGINVALQGQTTDFVQMTVTSSDPSRLLLSATPDGVGTRVDRSLAPAAICSESGLLCPSARQQRKRNLHCEPCRIWRHQRHGDLCALRIRYRRRKRSGRFRSAAQPAV